VKEEHADMQEVSSKNDRNAALLWGLAAAALMVLIFCFSGQDSEESSLLSGSILQRLLSLLRIEDPAHRETFHHLLRKGAHFTLYFALGVCLAEALGRQRRLPRFPAALAAAALYAVTDEFHQSFVPGRFGGPADVLLDTLGAAAGCLAVYLLAKALAVRRDRRRKWEDGS